MASMSTVLLSKWVVEQFISLGQHRPDLVGPALLRLLDEDAALRWGVVVNAYLERQINLGKAAELLEMHELELRERFLELGIPLRLGPADLAGAKAEAAALQNWLSPAPSGSTA